MAEIVNLRVARKTQKRLKDRAQADENATKFGRTKAQRDLEKAQAERARQTLDGAKRE